MNRRSFDDIKNDISCQLLDYTSSSHIDIILNYMLPELPDNLYELVFIASLSDPYWWDYIFPDVVERLNLINRKKLFLYSYYTGNQELIDYLFLYLNQFDNISRLFNRIIQKIHEDYPIPTRKPLYDYFVISNFYLAAEDVIEEYYDELQIDMEVLFAEILPRFLNIIEQVINEQ